MSVDFSNDSLLLQQLLHCVQEQSYILLAAGIAHQADAPHLVFQSSEACGDLDVVFIEQAGPDLMRIDSRWNLRGGQWRQPVFQRNKGWQVHVLQPAPECLGIAAQTGE